MRQPWLWAVFFAGKDVENRKWRRSMPPKIWLHEAVTCTLSDYDEACRWMASRGLATQGGMTTRGYPVPQHQRRAHRREMAIQTRGAIVGSVRVVAVLEPNGDLIRREGIEETDEVWLDRLERERGREWSWHMRGEQYGYVIRDPVLLDSPVPCRGMLGLFDVTEVLERAGVVT
jgi:hypothetical protein